MKSFLLNWNPKTWDWATLDDEIQEVTLYGSLIRPWRCLSKQVQVGDRMFLVRLGIEPKGVFGSGYAASQSYLDEDGINCVDIQIDFLINPIANPERLLTLNSLKENMPDQHWTPEGSGIRIRESVIEKLETLWFKNFRAKFQTEMNGETETYEEGKPVVVSGNRYERNRFARAKCLQLHGLNCSVCNLNFEALYGSIGKGYIHVHHITPISERQETYQVDPLKDLLPVCPNCHAMLHQRQPPYEVTELKAMLNLF
jgi:5-methylcytosine-specific restriction enzyme A